MSVVKELIRTEENGKISFGNYELAQKSKLSDFEYDGDMYKVKTYKDITKLERNGMFVYESVPGTTVLDLEAEENGMSFVVEGPKDAQITVELEEDTQYKIQIDGVDAGEMKTNLGGKLSFSVELEQAEQVSVHIEKL
ncbi:MAG TPA: endosialidase [Candidatus Blautia pullicola]|uniref:Endosialidase n=1 Tax=Candidatus Blautia pullicola TaxID=2838498 RepID=A0A9D2JUF4_9FIRM|nr:endosialidase [Candidatus Blautia pullicola]